MTNAPAPLQRGAGKTTTTTTHTTSTAGKNPERPKGEHNIINQISSMGTGVGWDPLL